MSTCSFLWPSDTELSEDSLSKAKKNFCGLNTYLYIPLSFQNRIPKGSSLQRNKQKASKDKRIVLPGKEWHALSTFVAGYPPSRFTLPMLRDDLTFPQHSSWLFGFGLLKIPCSWRDSTFRLSKSSGSFELFSKNSQSQQISQGF